MIKKIENTFLTVKKLLEYSTKKNCKKNQEVLRVGKVIKRKSNKLYAKCKGHNNY